MDDRTRAQLMFGNRGYHRHGQSIISSPTLDSFAERLDHNSPILRYLSPPSSSSVVQSPLSAVENLTERSPPSVLYGTPVKAMEGEEVMVMDGVLMKGGGGGRSNARGSASASGSSSSSGSSGKSRYKTEICHAWEDSANCRHGSKCQFAHGKEDLRPHRLAVKNKTDLPVNTKFRFVPQVVAPPMVTKIAQSITKTASPVTPKNISKALLVTSITSKEWLPQDDGIEVSKLGQVPPSNEESKPISRKDEKKEAARQEALLAAAASLTSMDEEDPLTNNYGDASSRSLN
ncbi:hypothetical protein FEM48_Zijuj09G0181500 [Ziziphus jujuba var. spinosa]|uniref:C3H1-type domain-containing protein n=1 Tax=Ziziphus jujuba var. spinosa TaxID=714518 RepID=A0A978UUI1_ZIZJJ|nr:hypothetical protein FEM48_Zijuj09G0181500 [Ziziphus jujuba var. spinosa]